MNHHEIIQKGLTFVSDEKLSQYSNAIQDFLITHTEGVEWRVEYDTCDKWNLFVKFMCIPTATSDYAAIYDIIEADSTDLMNNFKENVRCIANRVMTNSRNRATVLGGLVLEAEGQSDE